jgi:hypothetical protein
MQAHENRLRYLDQPEGHEFYDNMMRESHGAWGMSLWWAGLALLGVAAFLAYTTGPDLKRYMKIRNM